MVYRFQLSSVCSITKASAVYKDLNTSTKLKVHCKKVVKFAETAVSCTK